MIEECHYRISVKGIVIDDDGKVLLTREDNGMWELLGGGLEHNEDPIEGLKREIAEEAGLEVNYISPAPLYFLTMPRFQKAGFVANVIYEIKLADLNFTPSEECQELRFFSVEEMASLKLFPNVEKLRLILGGKPAST